MNPEQVVVSVEHASQRVPKPLDHLGLPPALFETHVGWDPGAASIGRRLAEAFAAPLHLGRWSRLVADLNRSHHHANVVPRRTGRYRIRGNADLSQEERRSRLERYWIPYRRAVEADLDRCVQRHGSVLHLSIHSFTPRFRGETRGNDFGLLYKPSNPSERRMADRWDALLSSEGFRVRRNYPYSGLEDGFCMRMRAERCPSTYIGMEIEMNQRCLFAADSRHRVGKALIAALGEEFLR